MDLNQLIYSSMIALPLTTEDELLKATTESVTKVIHSLLQLPERSVVDGESMIILPAYDASMYPRSKPLPKAKPLTKWQAFASKKGIKPKKKALSKFDEDKGQYVASWGYKSKDKLDDWCIEVPSKLHNAPNQDMFELKSLEKQAKKQKIQKQQENNAEFAATKAGKRKILEKKVIETRTSTASLGKFDAKPRNDLKTRKSKQSFKSNISSNPGSEVLNSLEIAKKILK